ncbi:hypothetical protein BGW36DRAFT_389321 [Talaromyces proteolyticus]|uniref:Cell surface protein n=1 Tax=Talaromyces proteolyticus TaxID=1131652 RepID=A0AAD4KI09_9EURO|nr:uncharacterized protein BGW36DRAFT_389321 [Talaromyces proteolyticus]KAH8690784.1 hypothetical protein BGW36DRAFT_389321 [Talaromyces proteolyticus]
MSNFLKEVKDSITHKDHDKPSKSSNAGPHDSNLANKLDPRVDSDRDNRAAGTSATATGVGGTTGINTGYDNPRSANVGPHDSSLANKADPRIDSDQSQYGAAGGFTSTGGSYDNPQSTSHGPLGSDRVDFADPSIGSNQGQLGSDIGGAGLSGNNVQSTNAGPHSSNVANKLDPRVDSDLDNRARHQNLASGGVPSGSSYATPGSGSAQQTAGPHDSNLANKLDPRVDSDVDNSRTVGGDATTY